MLLFGVLVLSLVLLAPAPSMAQEPPRPAYRIAATTCAVGSKSLPYLTTHDSYVAWSPGQFLPEQTPRLRCQVAETGQPGWRTMAVLVRDPDGFGVEAGVLVQLVRQMTFGAPQVVASVHSSNYARRSTPIWLTVPIDLGASELLDLSWDTYWIEMALIRRTALTVTPRIYQVVLR